MKDTSDTILANLEEEGDYYIAARGGAGGKGNSSFATSTDTAPHVAELGAEGESRELQVEPRVMAHAGLVSRNFPKINEPHHEKTNILASYLVSHKPGCTVTEDG